MARYVKNINRWKLLEIYPKKINFDNSILDNISNMRLDGIVFHHHSSGHINATHINVMLSKLCELKWLW